MNEIFQKSIEPGSSFDDYLLRPGYSDFTPDRASLRSELAPGLTLELPILSAAMDTVSEGKMGAAMARAGGCAVIHKNLPPARQAEEVAFVKSSGGIVAAAVGVGEKEIDRAKLLVDSGADALVVDTAHGHSKGVGDTVAALRKLYPKLTIIAGNVATAEGALFLESAGASVIKVGMGPGSICTTRLVSGCGVPQLYAIYDAVRALEGRIPVIADGGIRSSGDVVKAIAAGASAVMLGSMLAGTDEAPGNIIDIDGKKYKNYRGMGSKAAMKLGSADRYGQGKFEEKKRVAEGVESLLPCKGAVGAILDELAGGLRIGMGYVGAHNIAELWAKSRFEKISATSIAENKPHVFGVGIGK
ncbi:MAG: IMP dehydrogenase [Rickettsiales bacterium]|nr:IMP dehydrogenase [Rickettsiales bacterium]